MPSRKGKGRQSLGFGSKSQRAQFQQEWQTRLHEDYYAPRRKQQQQQRQRAAAQQQERQKLASIKGGKQPPKTALQNLLRRLIAERQYWDRFEDRSWVFNQQQKSLASASLLSHSSSDAASLTTSNPAAQSPPGWLVFHTTQADEADTFAHEFLVPGSSLTKKCCSTDYDSNTNNPYSSRRIPNLQSLALQALAKALPDYCHAMGPDLLHHYVSLLPGPAISVLSVHASQAGIMTNDLCRVLGQQSHVKRFSLVASAVCEETDPSYKALNATIALQETFLASNRTMTTNTTILNDDNEDAENVVSDMAYPTQKPLSLLLTETVPDCWEELADIIDDSNNDDNASFSRRGSRSRSATSNISPTQQDGDDEEISLWMSNNQSIQSLPIPLSPSSQRSSSLQLERLELGNLPLLEVDLLRQVLFACPMLTHLGLCGSLMYYDRGPDVLWQLSQWVPRLQVLDVSGNASWVTEPLLRSVYESYQALRQDGGGCFTAARSSGSSSICSDDDNNNNTNDDDDDSVLQVEQPQQQQRSFQKPYLQIVIKATGCLTRSSQIIMEMEFGTIF